MLRPRFFRFESVESTNGVALDMARRGEPEGTVVIADRQTKGRGRRGKTWWDEPGRSVLASAILAPGKPLADLPQLSFVASLAAAECLRAKCAVPAELKWPNDIVVGTRKIGGILVESASTPGGLAAVVGIGINVRQSAFPADIAETATSVVLEEGACTDVEALGRAVAETLLADYDLYLTAGFEEILRRWRNYMWGAGVWVEALTGDRRVRGRIYGVDSTGALIVEDALGIRHAIESVDELRTT